MDNIRGIALDALALSESGSSRGIIKDVLNKYDYLDQRDKAFIKLLYEGTLHRRITLDFILDKRSSVKTKKMRPVIRNILRMSLFQLLFTDAPSYAVVKESVDLARKRGFKQLSGFVNGILRNISAEIEKSEKKDEDKYLIFLPDDLKKDPARYLSLKYSYPEHITGVFIEEFGERAESILTSLSETRRISIRFRTFLNAEEIGNCISKMSENGEAPVRDEEIPFLYHADHMGDIRKLPGFEDGLFYIQDKSSVKAVMALEIGEGEKILDCCASPGGKSILASEFCKDKGSVTSCDISEKKAQVIRNNISRLKCDNINVLVRDASVLFPEDDEKYDSVILDVPCSGLGVIGRKREIALNLQKEDLESILTLQKQIIDSCVNYVKKGGKLLYSTCTVRRAENEDQVRYICEKYGFKIKKGPVLLLPDEEEQDGFFYTVLKK